MTAQAKPLPPTPCPTPGCNHPRLRRHCEQSRTCNWLSCPICKAFGIPGTVKWTGRLERATPPG